MKMISMNLLQLLSAVVLYYFLAMIKNMNTLNQ